MADHTHTKSLVMGHIEVMAPNGDAGIPYDEAVIHFDGDEESEILVQCPGALRLAPFIVKAVNSHDAMVKALRDWVTVWDQRVLDGPAHQEALRNARDALFALKASEADHG